MKGQLKVSKTRVEVLRQKSFGQPVVENPFFHRLRYTKFDVIRIIIMSITIAPLRLLLTCLVILMAWPVAAVGVACRSEEDRKKPLSGWRWGYMKVLRMVLRIAFFLLGFHWIKVKGERVTGDVAPIMCVAPHSSIFDVFVLLLGSQLDSGVSKEENANMPVLGHIIQFSQPVLVRRESSNSRHDTIKEIEHRSNSGGQWPQIFIFPEGTCTNRSCLITFKGGAFYPGLPVQPVCIRYLNKMDTYTWTWDGPGGFLCMWLTLCQFHNSFQVEYLPVYMPSDEEKKDPKLYAKNVRQVMADCLQIPVTDHTYDDCRLMRMAERLELPMEAGLVEFQKVHQKLGLTFNQTKEMLDRFQAIQPGKTGHITLEQFAEYLKLPVSPAMEKMFALYDRTGSGTIDFREYVIGLSLVSNPANTEEILQDAFQRFDKSKNGYITEEELQIILLNAFGMSKERSAVLFESVDVDEDGRITYEEFKNYAELRPEYAKLFITYHDMAAAANESMEEEEESAHGGNKRWSESSVDQCGNDIKTEGKLKTQ